MNNPYLKRQLGLGQRANFFLEWRYYVAEEGKTYVCNLCGQEVIVAKSGVGTLVCCDQPMELKKE